MAEAKSRAALNGTEDPLVYWQVLRELDVGVFGWHIASLSVIRAALVGGRRCKRGRWSPGCGVTRRCRRNCVGSTVRACSARVPASEERYVISGCALSDALLSVDEPMGGVRQKCLQNAVLRLLRGAPEELPLQRMLEATCSNDRASGGCECRIAQVNLYSVEYALRRLGLNVVVFGATSSGRFADGWLLGRWSLGKHDGRVVGGLAWFTQERHVSPLLGEAVHALAAAVPEACAATVPPWALFDVGAPKKKGE